MLNPNAQKWVDALRSGEYEQGTGCLYRNGKYCVFGVACEVYTKEKYHSKKMVYNQDPKCPPDHRILDWLGLKPGIGFSNLTSLNDYHEHNFNQIADYIENTPEIFKDPHKN